MSNTFRILKISKPFHKLLIILTVLIVVSAILGLVSSVLTKFIVDELQKNITTGNGDLTKVVWFFIAMLGFAGVSTTIDSIGERLGDYTSGRITKFLTEKFYRKIFTLSQTYFDSQISRKIVHQLNRGILSLGDFLRAISNFIFPALVQSFFIFFILLYYSWPIALLAFIVFPIYIGISTYSTKKWGEYQKKKNVIDDAMYGRIQEVLSNIKLVKSYGTHMDEWNFVSKQQKESLAIYDKQSTMYHILNFIRNFGLEFILTIIGVIVFYQTFIGNLTFGELVLVLQLLSQLRRPLFATSFILERIQQAEAGSKE